MVTYVQNSIVSRQAGFGFLFLPCADYAGNHARHQSAGSARIFVLFTTPQSASLIVQTQVLLIPRRRSAESAYSWTCPPAGLQCDFIMGVHIIVLWITGSEQRREQDKRLCHQSRR